MVWHGMRWYDKKSSRTQKCNFLLELEKCNSLLELETMKFIIGIEKMLLLSELEKTIYFWFKKIIIFIKKSDVFLILIILILKLLKSQEIYFWVWFPILQIKWS